MPRGVVTPVTLESLNMQTQLGQRVSPNQCTAVLNEAPETHATWLRARNQDTPLVAGPQEPAARPHHQLEPLR